MAKHARKTKPEIGIRVFGALNLIAALASLYGYFWVIPKIIQKVEEGTFGTLAPTTITLTGVYFIASIALAALFAVLGIRLIMGNRNKAGRMTNIMLLLSTITLLCVIAVLGIDTVAWVQFFVILYLGVLHAKIDPGLKAQREQEDKKYLEDVKKRQEDGTIGRDLSGKFYYEVNFFNLFWIWVIGAFLGCAVETVYCLIERGVLENRTGLLWGWWSPIYGFGAVFISMGLNRLHKSNIIVIFLIAGLIGAGTEFFVSWFMEVSFNIKCWDYSDGFLNIEGRTDLLHFFFFGVLGTVWVKWLQPPFLKFINSMPWKWRYSITALCAAFMIVNGAMTLLAIDAWTARVNGTATDTPIEQFFEKNYPNDWMQNHFQTMGIQKQKPEKL